MRFLRKAFYLALALFLLVGLAGATFISIDLGSEFVKVAGPKGQAIDILLNEQSNRKSPQFVGFRKGERFFGDDAKNLAARFPDLMIAAVSKYVGTLANDSHLLEHIYCDGFGYVAEVYPDQDAGGLVSFRFVEKELASSSSAADLTTTYSPEELLGMFFTYVKGFAEKELEGPVRDAVIVIPAALGPRQRQALVDSAALSGIRAVALIHGNTAAALTLGLQNRGFDKPTHVVIYDMGSTHTEATLFSILPPAIPSGGKRSTVADALGSITTLAVASDMALGGRSFDRCIGQMIEDEYVAKNLKTREDEQSLRVLKGQTAVKRRAAFSLMRAANKAKEVLSANQDLRISVENIAPDRDFDTKITRQAFETNCMPLFTRAVSLVDALFNASLFNHGLTLSDDVKRFELIGGGTRVPKLAELLKAKIQRSVDRTLNSDEAAVVGGGYYGAALTGHFRIKGFGMYEQFPDTYTFSLSRRTHRDDSSSRPVERLLFKAFGTSIPSRKVISLPNRTDDFSITLQRNGVTDSVTAISGVRSALDIIQGTDNGTSSSSAMVQHVTKITVRLAESGLVFIEDANLVVDYYVNVTRSVAVPVVKEGDSPMEEQLAASTKKRAKKNEAQTTEEVEANEKSAEEQAGDDGAVTDESSSHPSSTSSSDGGTAAPPAEPEQQDETSKTSKTSTAKKMVKKVVAELRQRTFPLLLSTKFSSPPTMTKAQATTSRERLRQLNGADDARREISSAKNDLEAYLIWSRSEGAKLFSSSSGEEPSAGTGKLATASLLQKADETEKWLEDYGSSDSVTRDDFLEKLSSLKSVVKRLIKGMDNSADQATAASSAREEEKREKNDELSTTPSSPSSEESASDLEPAGENGETEVDVAGEQNPAAASEGAEEDEPAQNADMPSGEL